MSSPGVLNISGVDAFGKVRNGERPVGLSARIKPSHANLTSHKVESPSCKLISAYKAHLLTSIPIIGTRLECYGRNFNLFSSLALLSLSSVARCSRFWR
jgi:hypothetical protein